MTKRFTIKPSMIVDDVTVIIDNQKEYTFPVLDSTLNYMFCKVLNEQHETIEQLKQQMLNLEEDLGYFKAKAGSLEEGYLQLQDREIRLKEENEQLKQSNERLLKMLDNVANYMQRENKYMPIDDFVEWWNGIATKGLDDGDVE